MSYIINGPVILGNTSTSTQINGNVSLHDVSSHTGDIFYTSNATGLLAALQHAAGGILVSDSSTSLPTWFIPVTLGQLLVSGAATNNPAWLAQGSSGQVLTSNGAGANPTWQSPGSEVGSYGFSANYANTTAQTASQTLYSTGNVNTTIGSFTVAGGASPPVWTGSMVGGQITISGTTYLITGWQDATHISVFPAPGSNLTNTAYSITYGTPVVLTNWDAGTAPFFDATAGGFVAATGIFTNSNAIGKYIIDAGVTFTDAANDGYRVLQVLRTASGVSTVVLQAFQQGHSNNGTPGTLTVNGSVKLGTSDTIKLQLVSTTATSNGTTAVATTAANGTGSTYWSMILQAIS